MSGNGSGWAMLLGMALCGGCASKAAAPSATAKKAPATRSDDDPAEIPPEVAAMMAEGPCQPRLQAALEDHAATVKDDEGKELHFFMIRADEKLCLDGASLELPKLLPEGAAAPASWVSVEMKLLPIGTVLVVKNQLGQNVRYRALVKRVGQPPASTSICPVRAGLFGVEHWPEQIEVVALGDFEPSGADHACR